MPRTKKATTLTRPSWAIENLNPHQEGDPDCPLAKVLNCHPNERVCSHCRQKAPIFVVGIFEEGKRTELSERCRSCAVSLFREKGFPLWVSGNSARTRVVWTTGKLPEATEERKELLRRSRTTRCNDKPDPESAGTTHKVSAASEGLPF